ncbi:hypothetical protein K458DRAFT_85856 [Lentithecium fluviatile CBS 122367]|uniref:Uncharacterized protein n=1 Tax=Lentithecium fluviatile CBS 122367 TaxID=1168545 RepID=A0A6G1ISJ2_9PLEO|nr:hypothetical protein K458DRAFT_85856 [Lentithecium fluviatile CBS 122367]
MPNFHFAEIDDDEPHARTPLTGAEHQHTAYIVSAPASLASGRLVGQMAETDVYLPLRRFGKTVQQSGARKDHDGDDEGRGGGDERGRLGLLSNRGLDTTFHDESHQSYALDKSSASQDDSAKCLSQHFYISELLLPLHQAQPPAPNIEASPEDTSTQREPEENQPIRDSEKCIQHRIGRSRLWRKSDWKARLARLKDSAEKTGPSNPQVEDSDTTTQQEQNRGEEGLEFPIKHNDKQNPARESNTWVGKLCPMLPHSAYNPYPQIHSLSSAAEIDLYPTLSRATGRKFLSQIQHENDPTEGHGPTQTQLEHVDRKLHLHAYKRINENYRERLGEYDLVTDWWVTGLMRRGDWEWESVGRLDGSEAEMEGEGECLGVSTSGSPKLGGAAVILLCESPSPNTNAAASGPVVFEPGHTPPRDSTSEHAPSSYEPFLEANPYATVNSEPWSRDIERAGDYMVETYRSAPPAFDGEEEGGYDSESWETISSVSHPEPEFEDESGQLSPDRNESIDPPEDNLSWNSSNSIRPESSISQERGDDFREPEPTTTYTPTPPAIFTYTAPFPPPKFALRRSPPVAPYLDLLAQITGEVSVSRGAPRVPVRRRDMRTLLNGSARILPRKKQGLDAVIGVEEVVGTRQGMGKTYAGLQAEIGGRVLGMGL